MEMEKLIKDSKNALATAGDMAAHGAEWLKSRDWKRYGENVRNAADDMKQCIYGKQGDDPPSNKGFITFSTFRFLVTPALVRILWFAGAYVAYPIIMYNIFDAMSEYRGLFGSGAFWKVILISIVCLIIFRLLLELFWHASRIHYSSKRTVELLEELVAIEKNRQNSVEKGGADA